MHLEQLERPVFNIRNQHEMGVTSVAVHPTRTDLVATGSYDEQVPHVSAT